MDDLRQKYKRAIDTAKSAGLAGFIGERDARLIFKGTVGTQEQVARIWNSIKDVPSWRNEVVADIQVLTFDARNTARGGNGGNKSA